MAVKIPVKRLKIFYMTDTGRFVILRPDGWYNVVEPESMDEGWTDYTATFGGGCEPNPMAHYPVTKRVYVQF